MDARELIISIVPPPPGLCLVPTFQQQNTRPSRNFIQIFFLCYFFIIFLVPSFRISHSCVQLYVTSMCCSFCVSAVNLSLSWVQRILLCCLPKGSGRELVKLLHAAFSRPPCNMEIKPFYSNERLPETRCLKETLVKPKNAFPFLRVSPFRRELQFRIPIQPPEPPETEITGVSPKAKLDAHGHFVAYVSLNTTSSLE